MGEIVRWPGAPRWRGLLVGRAELRAGGRSVAVEQWWAGVRRWRVASDAGPARWCGTAEEVRAAVAAAFRPANAAGLAGGPALAA
jgi:hypothetical protein